MDFRFLGALIAVLCLLDQVSGQDVLDYESEPISYSKSTPSNAIAKLNAEISAGRVELKHKGKLGYLPAVLESLKVPVSSQVLTFAQTSLQADRIRPKSPRAIYFSDDAYVGYVNAEGHGDHGPAVLELIVSDASLGVAFYTLDMAKTDKPQFVRQSNRCLTCHGGTKSRGVPGLQVRSVYPDPEGRPVLAAGSHRTDHGSPLTQRWGGWYVTGKHGDQQHLGNYLLPNSKKPKQVDNTAGQNLTDLSGKFDTKAFLSPHSDLVALMVLEHQSDAVNYMTRVRYEYQLAAADKGSEERKHEAVELLVKHLLFVGETKLNATVSGTSTFAAEFVKQGPTDKKGRSLRQLDLERRMFKFPLSYMVYSAAFTSLPGEIKLAVLNRIREVLVSSQPNNEFSHLTTSDKNSILELVADTVAGFPGNRPGPRSNDRSKR